MRLLSPWRGRPADTDFMALLSGLPDPALWLGEGEAVREANAALRQMLGPAVLIRPGTPVDRLFAAAARPLLRQWLQEGGEPPAELRLIAPEGQEGPLVAPQRLALPRGDSVLLLRDQSHRRALEARVAEADRLQALGALAGGIAHDFNNLLSVVLGAAEDAERLAGAQPAQAPLRAELNQIKEAARRGAALVRQMMAYARQQVLAPRLVPLNAAVEGIAQLLRPLLGQSIRLTLELDTPGRHVRIDPSQLDRVLMNLAMNARQAMPEGGELTLRTGRALLLQPQRGVGEDIPVGRWTVLEVEDTGKGIPPELLTRIFEPFFTGRLQQGGTGMGLATVHGIVRQSGGYVTVRSTPGVGSLFRILLPRVEEPAAVEPPAPAPEPPMPAPPASAPELSAAGPPAAQPAVQPALAPLLLVEDEAPLRRLAERALQRAGWAVMVAEDAESALEMLEEAATPPALMVTDVVMPGMDGTELARVVRQRFPGLPVLLVSGYAPSMVEKGLEGPGLHFLAKPYGAADLAEAARRAMAVETPLA